ncbi:hypothetical protein RhiirA4_487596 [Rhizophagus irregularis]|uniref:BAH domain-containing protein n=1 Tax=Rhizophagus irregularis TaxID=588596 RepID=A0A2I1HT01_9GLOM|nr:hypothetical protein RhiirA4_505863 [Rhizophagus irregularis]PKY60316.1 hypothetical protein RhiirA4_518118 [Rhizophagus irregularis]PKY61933.1 hypothetical protein RhiirA4_487596 [Rhizophagus irregularis]
MGNFYNIHLKKRISLKNIKDFVKFFPSDDHFMTELSISYNELGLHAALINSSIIWYEMASYVTEDTFGNKENICLKLGDVVTIQDEEYSESFAMIQSIFHHKSNNNTYFAFIIVTWFEEINQRHPILECPFFRLLTANDQQWRRIFPITVVDQVNKIHFVSSGMVEQRVNEDLWIKNEFYFTAV